MEIHRGSRENAPLPAHNRGKMILLPRYYLAPSTILTLLCYSKMMKIAATRSVFATKMRSPLGLRPEPGWESFPRLIVSWGGREHASHYPPLLYAVGISVFSVYGCSTVSASTCCLVLIIKSWCLCLQAGTAPQF